MQRQQLCVRNKRMKRRQRNSYGAHVQVPRASLFTICRTHKLIWWHCRCPVRAVIHAPKTGGISRLQKSIL